MILATKFKPDADAPFQTAIDGGMRAAELWTGPDVLDDWRGVVERAHKFDLRYRLHFPTKRTLTDEHLRAFVELARALDSRVAVIHKLEMDKYGAAVQSLDAHLELAVENGKISAEEFAEWETTNARLTFDAEHLWLFTNPGITLERAVDLAAAFLRRSGSKLRHVHLPGYYGTLAEHCPMHHGREFVTAILSLLDEMNYDGFVVSEVDMAFQNRDELRRDVELYAEWQRERRSKVNQRP